MSIYPPKNKIWWNEPVGKTELTWILIAFLWGLFMFFVMIYWHMFGEQNLSNEAYRTTPDAYAAKTQAMVDKYTRATDENSGMPSCVRHLERMSICMVGYGNGIRSWNSRKIRATACIFLRWTGNTDFLCNPKT